MAEHKSKSQSKSSARKKGAVKVVPKSRPSGSGRKK